MRTGPRWKFHANRCNGVRPLRTCEWPAVQHPLPSGPDFNNDTQWKRRVAHTPCLWLYILCTIFYHQEERTCHLPLFWLSIYDRAEGSKEGRGIMWAGQWKWIMECGKDARLNTTERSYERSWSLSVKSLMLIWMEEKRGWKHLGMQEKLMTVKFSDTLICSLEIVDEATPMKDVSRMAHRARKTTIR